MLLCCAFPWFIVGIYVDDFKIVLEGFKKVIIPAWITNIILILYCSKTGRSMSGNMEISYSILPITIISLNFALKEKNLIYVLSAVMSMLVILGVGSRGPLLCIAVFVILYLMANFNKNKILIIIVVIFSCAVYFNYNAILDGLIEIFEEYDISSRTLYKIRNGSIEDDTGRSDIQENAIQQLNENPILGTGIGVERIRINKEVMNKDMGSAYPHNLVIEIMTQYGYIMGSVILLYLIYVFIKSLLKSNTYERDILIILFSTEIIRLMLSSSYLRSEFFFLWLGLSINVVYRKRSEKNEKNSNNIAN